MKFTFKVLLVATMLLNTTIASAAFVVNNSNNTGYLFKGRVTGSFPSFTLDGSRGATEFNPNTVTYTDTFLSDTSMSFDWSYTTNDSRGSTWDKAGYVLNNVRTQLSTDGRSSGLTETGSVLISIMANDVFGWYVDSVDSMYSNATLQVTNASSVAVPSAVPVPAALPLMASALGLFGIARRRNRSKAV